MTTYSQSDLATRILKDLGLVAAEETPSASDLEWAQETVSSVTAQLAAEGIEIWNGSDQSLPLEYLVPLSKRIGLDIAVSFGLATPDGVEALKPTLNSTIRRLNAKQPTGAVSRAEYF
jgi:hypothetical protein